MKIKPILLFYSFWLLLFVPYSWGFVDSHSPFPKNQFLYDFIHISRAWASGIYILLFGVLFVLFAMIMRLVRKKRISAKEIWAAITVTAVLFFISFPGFSYDLFNYMATARVAFLYRENPYVIMPISLIGDPMLAFMHAANKVALYGPVWIVLTFLPHTLGFGKLLATLFAFKLFVIAFYFGALRLLWKISKKNLYAVAFFGLNPIVAIETLLSGHNDVVMMALLLACWYALMRRKIWWSIGLFISSVLIKYATVIVLPLYVVVLWKSVRQKEILWPWVWKWCAVLLFAAFLLSPIREEIYAWYFIWPLTFIALLPPDSAITALSYGFTFGLPYRFAPFVYWQQWGGATPIVKKFVTFIPPALVGLWYAGRKIF